MVSGNIFIFGVNNGSQKHFKNFKDDFLVLVEGPTDDTKDSVSEPKSSSVLLLLNFTFTKFQQVNQWL